MKNKFIIVLISISIIASLIICIVVFNKAELVAKINISIPSIIESSTDYTYNIYEVGKGKYRYEKIQIDSWIAEVISEKKIVSGKINNKEDWNVIRKDIEENYFVYPTGNNNVTIQYKDIKLNTLDELMDKLCGKQ